VTRGLFKAEISVDDTPQAIFIGPDGYHWMVGVPGSIYQIRVQSLAGQIGVAVAVDGLDVLEDKPADLANPSLQIISDGYTFRGFRVDDSRTRDFVFGTVEGSVADQKKQTGSIGTIGIAAWRELPHVTYDADSHSRDIAAVAHAGEPTLGTHAGEIKHDPVRHVMFERSGSPDVLEIGYNTLAALERMGVIRKSSSDHPPAFPGRTTGYEAYRS
jgi:hypothetical protein